MLPCIHRREQTGTVSICRRLKSGRKMRDEYAAFACALFGRCLPLLKTWQPQHLEAEAEIYHLCVGCSDRSPPT